LKNRSKNILKLCYQLACLLLVLLFFSISITQAFHSHKDKIRTEQSSNDNDEVSATDDCKICFYFNHRQVEQQPTAYPLPAILPIPEPISYNTKSFIGNYKFTLQGFTNKGPPLIIS
jgi:hypothetical protein